MIVLLDQPLKNVADEDAIRDHVAEVTMVDVAERGIEEKCTCFTITDKLVLEHEPNLARGDTTLLVDALKLAGDHVEDLGDDNALHVLPCWVVDGRGIEENVVSQIIALQGEQNLIAPAGIACS
jgi:hypothetical protein